VTTRVGINGFGRIGRNFFRAVPRADADIEIVGGQRPHRQQDARAPAEVRQHLGRLGQDVSFSEDSIVVGADGIRASRAGPARSAVG
jgi:glyceraldehyde 3-phosphate dehydrogenase